MVNPIKAVKAADKVLNIVITLLIVIAFLFAGSALWDTICIYRNAGMDSELLKYKPDGNGGENPSLEQLIAINPDVCAWLTLTDTHIDYPVVRGENNNEYINKNVRGEFALSGSIFLDYRNRPDFTDNYSLIYGHHMDGGVMFGDLASFAEKDFFNQHQGGNLYLPKKTFRLTVFACVLADAFDGTVFTPGANEPSQRENLLHYIRQQAVVYREIPFTPGDRILALSTCSSATTNGRTIVYARLTEVDE